MSTSKERYHLESEYSDIEKRAIAYLSKRHFATTSDCHHALHEHLVALASDDIDDSRTLSIVTWGILDALHEHLVALASDDIDDSRTLSIVTWGILEAIMKIIAVETGTGSNRTWHLKSREELSLFPEQIIKIAQLFSEGE